MVTRKDRRHSGYKTPQPTVPIKHVDKFSLFIDEIYDDWDNYRDGFRDYFRDFKLIKNIPGRKIFDNSFGEKRTRMNAKQKLLSKRRKAKREVRL